MKFLCVPCDTPMKLQAVVPPDRGSLSVVYACPECGYEIAMLTNAYETQVVQSLGVRIGPDRAIQGNLDPVALFAPLHEIERRVQDILQRADSRAGHIFNLGHGILPNTPVESVAATVEMVHKLSQR